MSWRLLSDDHFCVPEFLKKGLGPDLLGLMTYILIVELLGCMELRLHLISLIGLVRSSVGREGVDQARTALAQSLNLLVLLIKVVSAFM